MRSFTRHLIARHLRDERRRLEADNADQLTKAKDDVEKGIAWYGQRHAELTAENGRLATLVDDLTGALAEAEERAGRNRLAWTSARRRASREHDDVRFWMRMATYAEQDRDEAKDVAWRYRLAWMSAAARALDLRAVNRDALEELADHTPAVEITSGSP